MRTTDVYPYIAILANGVSHSHKNKEFHNEIFILENRRISRFSCFLDCL